MNERFCYGAFGLLLLVSTLAAYLWQSYSAVFDEEIAYLYNPETKDMFEINMAASTSSIHFWDLLSPLERVRRRDPDLVVYLGTLSEMRSRINDTNRNTHDTELHSEDLLWIQYFRSYRDSVQQELFLVPNEWADLINEGEFFEDYIVADAIIIRQSWPDGYDGEPSWPVEVEWTDDVILLFGKLAHEICVREVTLQHPRLEATLRQSGCFIPT